jgi:hypothetical protein
MQVTCQSEEISQKPAAAAELQSHYALSHQPHKPDESGKPKQPIIVPTFSSHVSVVPCF